MDHLLTADAAREYLGPHLPGIRACLEEADQQYRKDQKGKSPLSPRARACCVHDYVSRRAEIRFGDTPDVTLIYRDDDSLRAIAFGDRAVVRFKKLTRKLRIHAITTGVSAAWNRQEPLEDFPVSTNLVAGYVLDEVGELESLRLVCSLYGRPLWNIDLDDVDGVAVPVLDLLPHDAPEPERAMVRSDNEDSKEAGTEG